MKMLIVLLLVSDLVAAQNIEGKWRGEFALRDSVNVPFNFEIEKNNSVTLINGAERYSAGKAVVKKDSLFIPLDQFDNILAFKINKSTLTGVLKKQDGSQDLAYLKAEKNKSYRFKENGIKPLRDYTGKYEVIFKEPDGRSEEAIGLFQQKGNKLTATFLKPSGDTRYQEGIVEGSHFYLSSFIGSTPGYYSGEFINDDQFKGEQVGTKIRIGIEGKLNDAAVLPDAYSLTTAKDEVFTMSLPDINGNIVSLNDNQFKGKPVIIAITGTWCPNCIDEAKFLSPWYAENKNRGVEVIAVHFERSADTAFARKVMTRYKERFNVEYTQLFAGTTSKADIAKAFPGLNNFKAFPTTILIDKTGRVSKIHTGFSGPATGRYYEEFVNEFNDQMNSLLD